MEVSLLKIHTELSDELISNFILTNARLESEQKIIPSQQNCSLSYTESSMPSDNRIFSKSQIEPTTKRISLEEAQINFAVTKKKIPFRYSPIEQIEGSSIRQPTQSKNKSHAKVFGAGVGRNETKQTSEHQRFNTIDKNINRQNVPIPRDESLDKTKTTLKCLAKVYNIECVDHTLNLKSKLNSHHAQLLSARTSIPRQLQFKSRSTTRKSQNSTAKAPQKIELLVSSPVLFEGLKDLQLSKKLGVTKSKPLTDRNNRKTPSKGKLFC